jgi:double-stranded uracil-DNA glycosylase
MPIAISPPPAQSGQFDAAQGFPPIANDQARVLILGSMPGVASLRGGAYYAHPRNQFWPIMAAILDIDLVALDYPQRLPGAARRRHCAVGCAAILPSPAGSLDADIAPDSIMVNDFVAISSNSIRHPSSLFQWRRG